MMAVQLETADRRGRVFLETEGFDSDADSEASYAEIDACDVASNKSDSSSVHSAGEELANYWDPYLYQLQLRAPKPNHIPCRRELHDRPAIYGEEYHGSVTREETARLLGQQDGNYLVRQGLSHSGSYSLSFVFGGQVRHYRLFHDGHDHYVGEKPFETIEDLVQDGLITLYMEANNVDEYLQSARQTRSVQQYTNTEGPLDTIQEVVNCPSDEGVYSEGSEGSPPPIPPRNYYTDVIPNSQITNSERRPASLSYHPCTIPQLRNSTHSPENEPEASTITPVTPVSEYVRERIYEEVKGVEMGVQFENGLPESAGAFKKKDVRKESMVYFHYDKPHNFKLHNYIGLPWCDFCRNFMWGLRNQGYRCKDCGFNAHKQCKDDVASDCQPSRQLVKRVYGVELTTLVKMQGTKVPLVVKDCLMEVEERGLTTEGLYRISGTTSDILRLKKQFDHDMCADLTADTDLHAITGALKLYLRELPIPLMTFDAYDLCLIGARSNSESECLDMLKVALSRLPPAHYNTLRHLIRHLDRVQKLSDVNKMTIKNLAVVFTPTIMRSPYNTGITMMKKLPEQKKAVELLITHFRTLFQVQ